MKLKRLKELILPLFWLFILIYFADKKNPAKHKKQEREEIRNSLFANTNNTSNTDEKQPQFVKMQLKK